MNIPPQDVLTQPTRRPGEDTPSWRERYKQAHADLINAIMGLPNHVYHSADAGLPSWLGEPDVITLFGDSNSSLTMTVPAFQLCDGEPREVVRQVNLQLAMLYRQIQGPWVSPQLATIVWWLQVHPELQVAPSLYSAPAASRSWSAWPGTAGPSADQCKPTTPRFARAPLQGTVAAEEPPLKYSI